MTFVNLTGHDVYVYRNNKLQQVIPASEDTVRVHPVVESFDDSDGVNINAVTYKSDPNYPLPAPNEGTNYIVSYMIANHYRERSDLVYPFEIVRGNGGKVIGCRSFARPSRS